MGTFNQKNLMGGAREVTHTPTTFDNEGRVMATEGMADVAKVVGFVVIGFWVVGLIGFILQSVMGRKSRVARIQEQINSLSKLNISGKNNTTISREKLVAQLSKNNGQVNRLMAECVNEGSLWEAVTNMVKRGLFVWREKITVLEATIAIDKLYVARDEKVFPNRALKLAEEINASAAGVRMDLGKLAEELNKAGYKVENRVFFRENWNDLDGIRNTAGQLGHLYETFVQFAGEQFDVDRLSTKGEFSIGAFVSSVAEEIKNIDKESSDTDKGLKEVERIRMDKDDVRKFLSTSDEIKQADEILTANMKLLAIATKVRAACASASLRVEEAMLGALNNTLKEEYKKDYTPSRVGLESLYPTSETYIGETMIDRVCAENTQLFGTLLNIGTTMIREAGIQAELGGEHANKFNDSDVVRLLAARIQNRKKF